MKQKKQPFWPIFHPCETLQFQEKQPLKKEYRAVNPSLLSFQVRVAHKFEHKKNKQKNQYLMDNVFLACKESNLNVDPARLSTGAGLNIFLAELTNTLLLRVNFWSYYNLGPKLSKMGTK